MAVPPEELAALPEGPCRTVALRSRMMRSVTTCAQPQGHASLGLPAYVQFTSPIRRYTDLLAHWQLKVCFTCADRALATAVRAALGAVSCCSCVRCNGQPQLLCWNLAVQLPTCSN